MANETKQRGASRYKTEPVFRGHVHNSQFNDEGISVEPITEADLNRIAEAYPGLKFTPVEEPKAEEKK